MVQEHKWFDRVTDVALYFILSMLGLACLAPFIHVISLSLSSNSAVTCQKVLLLPVGFHLQNYFYLLTDKMFLGSFYTSVMRLLVGISLNLLFTVVTAYPLSQDNIYMPGRTMFKGYMLFGMMFSGGLIPVFLAYKALGLLNSFWVLVIPGALNVFLTIIVINFFRGIPRELSEAAMLDGASHLDVLFRVFVPISLPALATITLFSAVGHWNSWFDGILFLNKREMWPLQSYLYARVTTRQLQSYASSFELVRDFSNTTPEGLGAAFIAFAAIPIMLAYPFLQRYFVTGLTLGSVKG